MSLNSSALNTTALNTLGEEVTAFSVNITNQVDASIYRFSKFITSKITQEYVHSTDITNEVTGEVGSFEVPITIEISGVTSFSASITMDVVIIYNEDGSVNNSPPSEAYDPEALQDLANIYPLGGYMPPAVSFGQDSYAWSLLILVGGIDVSHMVIGEVMVNKEANQAAVCSFTLLDVNLTQAAVNSWNQTKVIVHFVQEGSSALVFEGGVVGFTFDPLAGTFSFSCTDNLQSVVQRLYDGRSLRPPSGYKFKSLDRPRGGNGWDWLLQAMAPVPLDFGLSLGGSLVFYSWDTGTPGATYYEKDIIDGSLSLELQDKTQVVNNIEVVVTETSKSVGFTLGATILRFFQTNVRNQVTVVKCLESITANGAKQAVDSASITADHSNALSIWTATRREVTTHAFSDTETKTVYLSGREMGDLVLGDTATEENKTICTKSVSVHLNSFASRVRSFYRFSGATSREVYKQEPDPEPVPDTDPNPCSGSLALDPPTAPAVPYLSPRTIVKDADDIALSGNHAEAAALREEMVETATKTIRQSHRGTTTSFSILCSPYLTWGHSAKVSVDNLTVSGRVSSVTHSLDVGTGKAITSVTLRTLDSGRPSNINQPAITLADDLQASDVNCTPGTTFDELTKSSTSKTSFSSRQVSIPSTDIQIGQY